MTDKPPAPDHEPANPWPDRIALALICVAAAAITVVLQRPKGLGLYADFWFGLMVALALGLGYAMLKRALGLPPVTLGLRGSRGRRGS